MELNETYFRDEDLPENLKMESDIFTRPLGGLSTEDIFSELTLRFPSFVFVGAEPIDDDNLKTYKYTNGNYFEQLGLASHLLKSLER